MKLFIIEIALTVFLCSSSSNTSHAHDEDQLLVMMKTTIDNIAFLLDRIEGVNNRVAAVEETQKEMKDHFEKYVKWDMGLDECLRDSPSCEENEECILIDGSYKCQCYGGFEKRIPTCEDIDECQMDLHDCKPPFTCVNTQGSYQCQCLPPFVGNETSCQLECCHPSLYLDDLGCITPILFRLNWEKAQSQCHKMNMRLLEGVTKRHLEVLCDHFLPLMSDRPFPWIGFTNKTWISTNQTILTEDLEGEVEHELEGDCGSCDLRLSDRRIYDYPCSDTEYSLCQVVD